MPTSRKRNRKPRRPDRRRARRPIRSGDRRVVATVRPGQDLEHLLTPADHAAMRAAVDMAARGDARAALECHLDGLMVEGSLVPALLRELVSLGEDAQGWPFARWAVDEAYRWMMLEQDPRTDAAVRLVLETLHHDHVAGIDDPVTLKEYGTLVAACDEVCAQVAVFEFGGLGDFLDVRAEPGLTDRADLVQEWRFAPMGAYAGRGTRGSVLVFEDMATGEEVEVLNIGAMSDRAPGAYVLGRLVPISESPYLMFERRPFEIDLETAMDVVRLMGDSDDDGLGWLRALAIARADGRLHRGFSCEERTLYLSDLTVIEGSATQGLDDSPRLKEWVRKGHSPVVANALGVLEVCLVLVQAQPSLAGRASPHLRAAFNVPGAYAAAVVELVDDEWASAWEHLAAVVDGQARRYCDELVHRCRSAA